MPCDAACKAKIILNGARVTREVDASLKLANHLELSEAEAYQLIQILDEAEDKLIAWNDRRLKQTGYVRRTKKFELEEV